jgi:hypothetical protein
MTTTTSSMDLLSTVLLFLSSSSLTPQSSSIFVTSTPSMILAPIAASKSSSDACPTNALHNPSFESGSFSPWIEETQANTEQSGVFSAAGHNSDHAYVAFVQSKNVPETNKVSLVETDIEIPDGTIVQCSLF